METTWVEVSGLMITSPVTAGTNLVLALQCASYARRFRRGAVERRVGWGRFFLAMAIATLAGTFKHGFAHLLAVEVYAGVLWSSSLTGGVAVYFAQRATIASRVQLPARRALAWAAAVQAALFGVANVVLGPEIKLLIAHTAVGLSPVIAAEAVAWRRGDGDGRRVASGLILSVLTGLVYAFEISLGRWFTHVDLAHALMGVSFYLIFAGVAVRSRSRVEDRRVVSVRSTATALGA